MASLAGLAVGAGTAHAQPTIPERSPAPVIQTGGTPSAKPETAIGLSPAQEKAQEEVQASVNALATRALHPSRHQHKTTQYFEDADGLKIAQTTVKIDGLTQHGSNRGVTEILVAAPVGPDGLTPDVTNINSVTINQGVKDEDGSLSSPTTSATIGKDPVSSVFELSGLFEPVKGGQQPMDASIADNNPTIEAGFKATFQLMNTIVSGAHSGARIDGLERPYNPANGATSLDFAD